MTPYEFRNIHPHTAYLPGFLHKTGEFSSFYNYHQKTSFLLCIRLVYAILKITL